MVARRALPPRALSHAASPKKPTRVSEGGGVGKGKKDTGYLYKAFMVARVPHLDIEGSCCV
jgi:hypothetical protein